MREEPKLTPMMEQYARIKEQHQDAILLFRLGDFYEMFFEDAVEASKILDITLTTRNKNKEHQVPLCGVPFHSVEPYIAKLLQQGKRVAICEQTEDPAMAKGVVRREVTRILTPGVVIEGEHLEAKEHNYVAALAVTEEGAGLAIADISTGSFGVANSPTFSQALEELAKRNPKEILIDASFSTTHQDAVRRLFPRILFTTRPFPDESFETQASSALWNYLKETQKRELSHFLVIRELQSHEFMRIDAATERNLELTRTMQEGEREGSLLWLLDRTRTAMGGRLLRSWILAPLARATSIAERLDSISFFVGAPNILQKLSARLSHVYDLERIASRSAMGTASARDLAALASSLNALPEIKQLLSEAPLLLQRCGKEIDPCETLSSQIEATLVEDPPLSLRDGGIIRHGVSADLDELRTISHSGKDFIAGLEKGERERTGISSLKVKFNKVFGYFIEITHVHRDKVPADYLRKQTLVNAERYITPTLKEYEEKVLGSEERSKAIEYRLFVELREVVQQHVPQLLTTARSLAQLDALLSLAIVAQEGNYTRPLIHDEGPVVIEGGRHPIIEELHRDERFVPNDLSLGGEHGSLFVITGPNMAGKSTVMRQTALVVLMAQIGSFVPAKRVELGVVDRIFTRIGASDALARGQSTFMVEMAETATILREATEKSLVIIDEIGRGTSTFDGLAISWAVAEDLHDRVKAKTLFATHYHELTALAETKPEIRNYHIAVQESAGNIVFLRRFLPGATSHSYGVHVAKLAGLPPSVIGRAREVLSELESGEMRHGPFSEVP